MKGTCLTALLMVIAASALSLPGVGAAADAAADGTGERTSTDEPSAPPLPEAIADTEQAERYIDSQACISTRAIRDTRVIDERKVLFYVGAGKVYLNQMHNACWGISDHYILMWHQDFGSRLCDLDRLRVLDRFSYREETSCSLGRFESITKEHADFLVAEASKLVEQKRRGKRILDAEAADAKESSE